MLSFHQQLALFTPSLEKASPLTTVQPASEPHSNPPFAISY